MITREAPSEMDWPQKLAAPLPLSVIAWRQDGKPTQRDGRYFARFVAYVEAGTVRERLDAVVPGEWDLTLELLPAASFEGEAIAFAFKARLQILGVLREDIGQGQDYKAASTDAFKRAAVRFGIGHELYQMEQLWVQVDSDSKYAKPVEDPSAVYARKVSGAKSNGSAPVAGNGAAPTAPQPPKPNDDASGQQRPREEGDVIQDGTGDPKVVGEPDCPKCGGRMWDNRMSKRNPKAPDYKCRNRGCDGVVWPPKGNGKSAQSAGHIPGLDDADDIPF